MTYFEPWDWIISANAYRSEFEALVKVEDFRDSVESLRFVGNGYAYVVDLEGTAVIHPLLPRGTNIRGSSPAGETAFLEEMLEKRRGETTYRWKNPEEPEPRWKIVVYDFVPTVDWIVASSAYRDVIFAPVETLHSQALMVALLCLVAGAATAVRISDSITRPIRRLTTRLSGEGAATRYEVRQLATHFDHFLAELERESRERRAVERRFRSSEERYRALMALAPDPVMVDISLKGRNGLELVKILYGTDPDLPIRMISTHEENLYSERSLRTGTRGYVMKHETADSIVSAVRAMVAGRVWVSPRVAATLLALSHKTIGTYRERLKEKLGLRNSAELLRHAVQWLEQRGGR